MRKWCSKVNLLFSKQNSSLNEDVFESLKGRSDWDLNLTKSLKPFYQISISVWSSKPRKLNDGSSSKDKMLFQISAENLIENLFENFFQSLIENLIENIYLPHFSLPLTYLLFRPEENTFSFNLLFNNNLQQIQFIITDVRSLFDELMFVKLWQPVKAVFVSVCWR
jgi:hypothetical protein